jgi:hypothetical protein
MTNDLLPSSENDHSCPIAIFPEGGILHIVFFILFLQFPAKFIFEGSLPYPVNKHDPAGAIADGFFHRFAEPFDLDIQDFLV